MRRYCIESCGRETGAYAKAGRRNPYWCPECDKARIDRITRQFEAIDKRFTVTVEAPSKEAPHDAN